MCVKHYGNIIFKDLASILKKLILNVNMLTLPISSLISIFCLSLLYFVFHEADLYRLYHLDSFALSLLVGLIQLELKEIRE